MRIGERLRNIREKKGISRKKLATHIGENHRKIEHFEYGTQRMQADLLPAMCQYLGVSVEYLVTGKDINTNTSPPNSQDIVHIPFYGDTPVSAGGGRVVWSESVTTYLPFDKAWLQQRIGTITELIGFPVMGDSMEPTYTSGDTVICSVIKKFIGDGVYVICLDDTIMVKRLSLSPNRILHVISDNPLNPNYQINLSEENLNFYIIALVKGVVKLG